jgi:3',5'-cyclic AMP phosphodiesterase CpdA
VSYSFKYGNVGFISLDANDVCYELEANLGYTGGAQTTWLGSTLATMRGDRSIDFIVAFFHQCAYSTCNVHASDGGIDKYWTPLFDQYQVDLVINGHNHVYERTDPIRGGSPTGEAPIGATIDTVTQGTTYVTAGGAGKSLYGFGSTASPVPDSYLGNVNDDDAITAWQWELGSSPSNPVQSPITVAWSRVRYTGYGLLVVDSICGYRKPQLSVRAVMEDGVTLIDEFSIVRDA